MTNLLNQLKEHKSKTTRSDSSLSSEYEQYVHSNFITHLQYSEFAGFDVLGFWKAKELMFPVLSRMTMDILSVQATSDHLDAQERKQHTSTLENALDFKDEILDAEVQENEATPLSDEEIALDASSQGTIGSGSGGEKQDFDYDLTNYDIDD
ncbi:zinc finger BED domain-containing protein RICESLEEPER 2-like protein [Tanacetum coccineum]